MIIVIIAIIVIMASINPDSLDVTTRGDNVTSGSSSIDAAELDALDAGAKSPPVSAVDPPETVRFIVSGEPFDIPWNLLTGNWRGTGLFNAANFALSTGKFDPNDKYDPASSS